MAACLLEASRIQFGNCSSMTNQPFMIKNASICLVFVGLLLAAPAAKANLYTDINTYTPTQGYVSTSHSLTDSFDIGALGFDSSIEQAVSGVAAFLIADASLKQQTFTIDLGGQPFADQGSLSFGLNLVLGSLGTDVLLSLNQNNGVLDYTVTADGKSTGFYVLAAGLQVNTAPSTIQITSQRVPDGGFTLALLGGGVLALCAVKRRQ